MLTIVLSVSLLADPAYLHEIATEEDFNLVAQEDPRPDITARTKYLAPASDDPTLLAMVYQNVNMYLFHLDFMASEFPDRFPGLTTAEYHNLVEVRASRRYFAGALWQIVPAGGDPIFGFDLYTDPSSPNELPIPSEVDWVYRQVTGSFHAGPVAYAPTRPEAVADALSWEDTPFPIYIADQGVVGDWQAYVLGTAYGRVRLFTVQELFAADAAGLLSWQDVIVVDAAPGDLTAPVAAVLTKTPQAELSHLSLRLSQRGTPNAYDANAMERLGPYESLLVRLDIDETGPTVELVANPAEAEAWWATHRVRLPQLPMFDLTEQRLATLEELSQDPDGAAKYGAKAYNTALLRAALPPANTVPGFAVPFYWYERYMTENFILPPGGGASVSYAAYLVQLQAEQAFRTDPVYRTQVLGDFVDYAEDIGTIPTALFDATLTATETVFADMTTMLRARSSANYEDVPYFNGAGLYLSTSMCPADSLDIDNDGPSACDPLEPKERTIHRALRQVWTSLWLPRAFNERDFWQGPQDRAKMGILVTPRFEEEAANGVVLTGNPSLPGDNRFVINVQQGEVSVVSPPEGVLPEKILLTVEDGTVTEILRVRSSTILPPGENVLSDDEARQVGELSWQAKVALEPHFATGLGETLADLEFKVVADPERRIIFKQARPFLRKESTNDVPVLAVVVPDGARVCGVFRDNRTLKEEYDLLSCATLIPGRLEFPAKGGEFQGDLFEEILIGPEHVPAEPTGPGTFTCTAGSTNTGKYYNYRFEQSFTVAGRPLQLEAYGLDFRINDDGTGTIEIVMDEAFLTLDFWIWGSLGETPNVDGLKLDSCSYAFLPLFEATVAATSGESATLHIRFEPPMAGSGPANVVWASVTLGGETREVDDYWHLVYAANHHNWNERYWILLDPPMPVPLVGDVHVVEVREPSPFVPPEEKIPTFKLLDADFRELHAFKELLWERRRIQDPDNAEFRRGDPNNDHEVQISDAVSILSWLFANGTRPACPDAADATDDGRIDISDAIRILLYIFWPEPGGWQLPRPGAWHCGKDLTPDDLPACDYDVTGCGEW